MQGIDPWEKFCLVQTLGVSTPSIEQRGEVSAIHRATCIHITNTGATPIVEEHRDISGINNAVLIQVSWVRWWCARAFHRREHGSWSARATWLEQLK